jgi:hypothetical protein
MNTDDYAILVGIDKYPGLGDGITPANLKGPLNDVNAVAKWLTAADGGDLPPNNIIEISSQTRETFRADQPNFSDVTALLNMLYTRSKDSRKSPFGRRIYIYMAGHGFSPGRMKACLYTAEATIDFGQNVHATGWLSWLQDSGYFREYVLWVDACMDRQWFFPPGEPSLKPINKIAPPSANFVAFAAQRPLKALEHSIPEDGDNFHGAFTWALLKGLRGAAADVNGRVTGRSLADWIRNAMSARYTEEDRQNTLVSKEPEVIAEDPSLIFIRGAVAPKYDITLNFTDAAQRGRASIWAGTPPTVVQTFTVDTLQKVVSLRPGLYVLSTEMGGFRQGFEVLESASVDIQDTGPLADSPLENTRPLNVQLRDFAEQVDSERDRVFTLTVAPEDLSAEIFVIDSRFSLVDCNLGRLSTPLPLGIFKIKIRISNAITERIILLDRDHTVPGGLDRLTPPATVIPLSDTAATHEYHEYAREKALKATAEIAVPEGQASFMLMVRSFNKKAGAVENDTPPWKGVQIVDADGQVVVDMEIGDHVVHEEDQPDGVAYASVVVAPGCYYLRQRLSQVPMPPSTNGSTTVECRSCPIEQSVIACSGWRTEVYILRRVLSGSREADVQPQVAISMRRHDTPMTPDTLFEDRLLEIAKLALGRERRVLNDALEEKLMKESANPIAGIIGGHLLLVEHDRDPRRDISLLDTLVTNLRKQIGENHPDVEALAKACRKAKISSPLVGPPMFQRSWTLLAHAAHKQPDLIPASMWTRVHAATSLAPFMVWTTDERVKTAARHQLAHIVLGDQSTLPLPPTIPLGHMPDPQGMIGSPANAIIRGDATMVGVAAGLMPSMAFGGNNAVSTRTQGTSRAARSMRARAIELDLPPSALDVLAKRQ